MPPIATSWHIVTGEYPPAPGGVSDYSRSVALGLAAAGDHVHIWAPSAPAGLVRDPGVEQHRLTFDFWRGARGMKSLAAGIGRPRGRARVLLQYVPQAFGAKAANVAFCVRLAMLRQAELWIMFHEVALGWGPLESWRRNGVSAMHRVMANVLLARADRVFVSIPMWETVLRRIAPLWRGRATWLPVPSNVPTDVLREDSQSVRGRLSLGDSGFVIGHFGTYGGGVAPLLKRLLLELLRGDARRIVLLVGRGSDEFAVTLGREPGMIGRAVATGALDSRGVAAHILACDVLVQPYPDGVSTRRTSTMAGLALGVPIVTNEGPATEPVWRESGGVALSASSEGLACTADRLLAHPDDARTIAVRGRALYVRRFAVERTIERLRGIP
jgi:glycosyltransferase involved in cell wall biosynthesis